jgi:hypothetical protein
MQWQWLVFALMVVVLVTALIRLNIWYWKRRSKMTPEERRFDDADNGRISGDW